MPRRRFKSVPGLVKHITYHHAGSAVDEDTCALFVAIERVTTIGSESLQSVRASHPSSPAVGDTIMEPLAAPTADAGEACAED